jgi:hypothetical protein
MAIDIAGRSRPVHDMKLAGTLSNTCFVGVGKNMSGIFFTAADQVTCFFPSGELTFTPTANQYVPFAPLGITSAGSGSIYSTF